MSANAFAALLAAGKISHARDLLIARMEQQKLSPDTVKIAPGGAVFTRRGKQVELDARGYWRLKLALK